MYTEMNVQNILNFLLGHGAPSAATGYKILFIEIMNPAFGGA